MPERKDAPRLFVEAALARGAEIAVSPDQTHYLLTVLRRAPGDPVLLFNGRDGEWSAHVARGGRRECVLTVTAPLRAQGQPPDIHYLFAPLKRARLDFVVQKATELGASRIRPVITRHVIVSRVNEERLRANVIEAAEQCGATWVPELDGPANLDAVLEGWEPERALIFCDEAAEIADPIAALSAIGPRPSALLIGPEGGFSADERQRLRAMAQTTAISLGPRILRADTAGIAALALVQAALGDWRRA